MTLIPVAVGNENPRQVTTTTPGKTEQMMKATTLPPREQGKP
jgi:hypothetical protein